jgi:hypothetical protein
MTQLSIVQKLTFLNHGWPKSWIVLFTITFLRLIFPLKAAACSRKMYCRHWCCHLPLKFEGGMGYNEKFYIWGGGYTAVFDSRDSLHRGVKRCLKANHQDQMGMNTFLCAQMLTVSWA